MSTQSYAVLLLNHGFQQIDYTADHERRAADAFLKLIGHHRHIYTRERIAGQYERFDKTELLIFANASGVIAFNFPLALDMALGGKKALRAAQSASKLLAVAYNDQCLIDAFSYYENGLLKRQVCEMDGYTRADVVQRGELLEEEIRAILEVAAEADSDPDADPESGPAEFSEYIVAGKAYRIEGYLPLYGCGLLLAKRLVDVELDALNPKAGSVYVAKPWWRFW